MSIPGRSAPIWYLWAQPDGSTTSQRVDLSKRVKTFSFTENEKTDKLALTIENQDYSSFANQILAVGTTLTFQYGYADGSLSGPRTATVTKVSGGADLSVEATGGAFLLDRVPKTRTFQQMRRSDVARQIATENGYTASNTWIADSDVVLPIITQARLTDAALLRTMANKDGFQFFLDSVGFHYRPRDLAQAPRRSFIYFTDPGQGDILAPPHVEQDVRGKPGAIAASGIDSRTGKPFSVTAENATDKGRPGLASKLGLVGAGPGGALQINAQSGAKTRTGIAPKVGQDRHLVSTAKTADDAKAQVQGLYGQSQTTSIKVTFPAVGDPTFGAKCVFTLGGAVGNLAGNYYATEVKHDLSPSGGYKMTINKARSDGTATAIASAVKSTAAVNSAQGPTPTGVPDTTLQRRQVVNGQTGVKRDIFVPAGTPPTPIK